MVHKDKTYYELVAEVAILKESGRRIIASETARTMEVIRFRAVNRELVIALAICGDAFQRIGLDHGVRVDAELKMIRAAIAKA